MKNSWKKTASFVMALALVAGTLPANVGGLLTVGNGIVASAAEYASGSVNTGNLHAGDILSPGVILNNTAISSKLQIIYEDDESLNETKSAGFSYLISTTSEYVSQYFDFANDATVVTFKKAATRYSSGNVSIADLNEGDIINPGAYVIGLSGWWVYENYNIQETAPSFSPEKPVKVLEKTSDKAVHFVDVDSEEPTTYTDFNSDQTYNLGDIFVFPDNTTLVNSHSSASTWKVSGEWRLVNYTFFTFQKVGSSEVFTTGLPTTNASQIQLESGKGSESSPYKFKLAPPSIGTAPAAGEVFYNGEPQDLLSSGGTAINGTMEYALSDSIDVAPFEEEAWSPSIPKATDTGTYYVWYRAVGDNKKAIAEQPITVEIGYKSPIVTFTSNLSDSVIYEGSNLLTPTEEGYVLSAKKTYTIYSNKSIEPVNDSNNKNIMKLAGSNEEIGGVTYAYKYTFTIPEIPAESYLISHKNNFFGTVPNSDRTKVYVSEDNYHDGDLAAYLSANNLVRYGDSIDASLVNIVGAYSNIIRVDEVYIKNNKGTHLELSELEIGKQYILTADLTIDKSGDFSDDDATGNTVHLEQNVTYTYRPMSENKYFLVVDPNDETKNVELGVEPVYSATNLDGTPKDGATITGYEVEVPADKITYNGTEQKPVIKVKNGANETVLTADDYTDGTEGKTDAGSYSFKLTAVTGDNANYTGSVNVNWSIAKANADIQVKSAENIVYDGAQLDKTDFVFEGKNAALVNDKTTYPDTTVTVTGTDITNAGDTTAKVKLTFANYNDIELDVPATINKREVKVTPAANQSLIYGTEKAPVLKVATEKAADADGDGEWDTNTGVIPADAKVDFVPAVDIAEFDYTYFVNNAGTYSYKISDAVLDNYTAILDGTAVFTVKPKELTKDMFTVDAVDYTFDSTQHNAPEYIFSDGKFSDKKRTAKLTANDFEEGGTDHAVLPGSYTLEFSGQGNYTGYVTFDWEIKPINEYAVSLSVNSKTYDGKTIEPTSFVYKSDDSTKTAVTLPGEKTVYTYYEYDGESTVDDAYIKTLTALDGTPKDAGKYIVVATATAKGYSFEKVYTTFTISQKEIAVTPNATGKTFGEADPDLADFTYDKTAVAEGDTLTISGKYALKGYNGNVGTYDFTLGTLKVDSDNYFLTISGAYVVNVQELTDANITVIKDCTVSDDGWWYPGDCIKVTGTVGGKEIELVRPVYDSSTNSYINTDFEFISATKTKKTGEFSVQIKGSGNYTGYAEAIINVRNADYDRQAAIEAGIGVDLADAVLKDGTKARFLLTPTLADGWTVESYGIIYDKTGAVKDAEAAKSGLVLGGSYVTKTCSAKDGTAYALNVTPINNNTIWAVGYITVRKGTMSTTIYTEPKSSNVTELQIEANVSVTLADAVLKDGTKARFLLTPEIADGWTVDAYGIVYDKTGAITDEAAAKSGLVLGGSYVTKTCSAKDGTTYALNVTPINDNTIWAVGFITVTKDGQTITIYTEPKSAKISELK